MTIFEDCKYSDHILCVTIQTTLQLPKIIIWPLNNST